MKEREKAVSEALEKQAGERCWHDYGARAIFSELDRLDANQEEIARRLESLDRRGTMPQLFAIDPAGRYLLMDDGTTSVELLKAHRDAIKDLLDAWKKETCWTCGWSCFQDDGRDQIDSECRRTENPRLVCSGDRACPAWIGRGK